MELIKRFALPIAFLVAFFLSVSALYTDKALLESKGKDVVRQALDLLEQHSVEDILRHVDGHYTDAENLAGTTEVISGYKQKLSKFAGLKKRQAALFSARSATLPLQSDNNADIFIVHADYEKGQLSYTLGIVRDKGTWYIDRLSILANDYFPDDQTSPESTYKITVFCNEEKGIKHKCHKPKVKT